MTIQTADRPLLSVNPAAHLVEVNGVQFWRAAVKVVNVEYRAEAGSHGLALERLRAAVAVDWPDAAGDIVRMPAAAPVDSLLPLRRQFAASFGTPQAVKRYGKDWDRPWDRDRLTRWAGDMERTARARRAFSRP